MEAIVSIIRQRTVFKIEEHQSDIPQFRGMFGRVMRLDQSSARETF